MRFNISINLFLSILNVFVFISLLYLNNKSIYFKREYLEIQNKINSVSDQIKIYEMEISYINNNINIEKIIKMYLPLWQPLNSDQIIYCKEMNNKK